MIRQVATDQAPEAIGPYAQAVKAGDFLFLSGQLPINPDTNEIAHDDVRDQTRQIMKNIKAILAVEEMSINNLVKMTIFVKDLGEFSEINEEYKKSLGDHRPARSTVEVSRLPKDVLIEIEAVASK